jgi:hypothetical protein
LDRNAFQILLDSASAPGCRASASHRSGGEGLACVV